MDYDKYCDLGYKSSILFGQIGELVGACLNGSNRLSIILRPNV